MLNIKLNICYHKSNVAQRINYNYNKQIGEMSLISIQIEMNDRVCTSLLAHKA